MSRTFLSRVCLALMGIAAVTAWFSRPAAAKNILFIGNTELATLHYLTLVDRLTNVYGHTVTVRDDNVDGMLTADDAAGKDMVIISSTVVSGNLLNTFSDFNTTFRAMGIPVLTWESAIYDDLGMTATGTTSNVQTIEVPADAAGHKLLLGLPRGTFQVRSLPNDTTSGLMIGATTMPAPGLRVLASVANGSPTIGVVEPGGLLNDGVTTASARRMFLCLTDFDLDTATFLGTALFDVAVADSLGISLYKRGDFNGDNIINLSDYDVFRNNFRGPLQPLPANYLTTVSLTDYVMDYAPGDTNFDGVANLHDFVAFVQLYNEANPAAVPEPSSVLLIAFGSLALGWIRRRSRGHSATRGLRPKS